MFSSLDACGAYHAVRIEPGSHACTAFISLFGTFRMFHYIRMPFGLANTGSVYSRMLDMAMKYVDMDCWTSYLDDILTFCREPWAHFENLAQEVKALAATGIKKQPIKTKLFQSEVEYLGHKFSKGGVSMIPDYVQKTKNWPVPKNGKELATFLGFAGYYRTFFPQYSVLTNRLNATNTGNKLNVIENLLSTKTTFV